MFVPYIAWEKIRLAHWVQLCPKPFTKEKTTAFPIFPPTTLTLFIHTSAPLKTGLIPWSELTLSGKSSARICLHKESYTCITLWACSSPVLLSDEPAVCSTQSSWLPTNVIDSGSTPPCLDRKNVITGVRVAVVTFSPLWYSSRVFNKVYKGRLIGAVFRN